MIENEVHHWLGLMSSNIGLGSISSVLVLVYRERQKTKRSLHKEDEKTKRVRLVAALLRDHGSDPDDRTLE